MSTFINVTVDGGGLSERAKAQTNANRQAKLEGDNRQKVEAQGRDQRDTTRAQQGIGPDGQPLYGTPARNTPRRDEPAASRQVPYFLLEPTEAVAGGQIRLQSNGYLNYLTVDSGNEATYSAAGGPSGTAALLSVPAPTSNYVAFLGRSTKLQESVGDFTLEFYIYLATTVVPYQSKPSLYVRVGAAGGGYIAIDLQLDTLYSPVVQRTGAFIKRSYTSDIEVAYDYIGPVIAAGQPGALLGQWTHVALSKRNTDVRFFMNGALMRQVQLGGQGISLSGGQDWVELFFGTEFVTTAGETVKLHGLRFEKRARYTEAFVPPLL